MRYTWRPMPAHTLPCQHFSCRCACVLAPQVFRQRLEQEHGASVICTSPTVPCRVVLPGGETLELQNPAEFPLNVKVAAVWEPTVAATVVTPNEYVGAIMQLCQVRGWMWVGGWVGRWAAWGWVCKRDGQALLAVCSTCAALCAICDAETTTGSRARVVLACLLPACLPAYLPGACSCLQDRRGEMQEHAVLGTGRTLLK